jgi:hypothetical protein
LENSSVVILHEIGGSRGGEDDVGVCPGCDAFCRLIGRVSAPSGLKMEMVFFFKMLVSAHESTQHHNSEEHEGQIMARFMQ